MDYWPGGHIRNLTSVKGVPTGAAVITLSVVEISITSQVGINFGVDTVYCTHYPSQKSTPRKVVSDSNRREFQKAVSQKDGEVPHGRLVLRTLC